jgi:hypothetical protein
MNVNAVGLAGWGCFFLAVGPAWSAVSLVAVVALAALTAVAWYLPRARAERRWQVALDRYAAREIHAARRQDARIEDLAAELTAVASPRVLRRRPKGSSIELELGLWRALARTLKEWGRDRPAASSKGYAAQESLLAKLTDRARCYAVASGVEGSVPELESVLYLAFRSVINKGHGRGASPP